VPDSELPGPLLLCGVPPRWLQASVAQSVYGNIIVVVFDRGGTLLKVIRQDLPSSLLFPAKKHGYESMRTSATRTSP